MPRLAGPDRLLDLAGAATGLPGVEAVEVLLVRADTTLTRFADSRIHQNVARSDGAARVRVVLTGAGGARTGVGVTNELAPEAVRRAAEQARTAALVTPPDPSFAGLAEPVDRYPDVDAYDERTAGATPALRADLVARMLAELPRGTFGAGAVATDAQEVAVANSLGVRAYGRSTRAALRVLASGADSTGYAEAAGTRVGELVPEALGERAAGKVARGAHPRELAPGSYPVVLEPMATATLVMWLGWSAFGGKAVHEGRSPLSGRIGEQVLSPLVTIVDDATSPLLPDLPFDAEGTPKRPLPLIERGVAVGVAHDRWSAKLAGAPGSTGHALPAPGGHGGLPTALLVEAGDQQLDALVAGLERGLLVTRFHYTGLVHPTTATITGMTRDGTFWVEDGRIVHGVRNLRFTQSIMDALADVRAVGGEAQVSRSFLASIRAPAVRLGSFSFTSATAH
ncbi:MAG: TldD/PmbA family protein [Frankiaceae bacterium]